MPCKLRHRLAAAAAMLLTALSASAAAPYPSKPVRLISPYSPGGGNDLIARAVANKLGAQLGQTVIVENREGGGGNIGTDYVAKAAPDGYTLLMTAQSLTMRPAMFKNLPFDVEKDFVPLGIVGSFPILFLAHPGLGIDDIAGLIRYAKAHPGKLSYGTPGVGTTQHVAMELFKAQTGTDLLHIPYKGASKAVTDSVSGVLSLLVSTPSSVMSYVDAGQLRLLGTGEERRLPELNDAPTIGETVAGYRVNNWLGLMAPAGTPQPIVDRLNQALVKVCADPDFIKQLAGAGFTVKSQDAASMAQQVSSDVRKWSEVIASRNIHAD
ncbi:tripartite tricarboxylate transporter substrate binding protein [Pigmentiphaga soli]|uniref:Tripartite tricarboxylate transporter substrate binding protein n=1 Tax=Pigmentiphaga soli TaxID=1007095 RepID=A0ABP8HQ04_9BURK